MRGKVGCIQRVEEVDEVRLWKEASQVSRPVGVFLPLRAGVFRSSS